MEIFVVEDFKCPNCDNMVSASFSSSKFNKNTFDYGNMGVRYEYEVDSFPLQCTVCSHQFTVSGSFWEYPEGAFETSDLKVD
ncbi:hypothetical protein [Lactococcus lactis]|uniref:hypothetical protein n=1 Tax=Lactococcus lactis TaxID=1358 RepID=UPI0022DFDC0C|nr:hypothetical protein [Lactococcus lactis]